ncbi:hypothetical protein R5W23_003533 [Gemmata sp. JC673]|uniref:Negative modulator of initiation of replication n=1 Tax=Gemmata algarum TaxID=2975278 RepID=A0ABU5F3D1_9BACT|nr:hypothetical protein [Gemmata algarum]MDY3562087.1 hypothetical protein [Gemmata algarum]
MHKIDIDDEVYEHLLRATKRLGESANDVLRRELKIGKASVTTRQSQRDEEMLRYINSSQFRAIKTATKKYLAILIRACDKNEKGVAQLLELPGGRERVYFARKRSEIENTGKSTHPEQIPTGDIWVLTNMATDQKRSKLTDALGALGYGSDAITQACAALA